MIDWKPAADFEKQWRSRQKTFMRRIAADLFRRVVERTPVDTGRARANWDLTINNPSDRLDIDDFGQPVLVPPAIAQITGKEKIYLVNNLPYIERLEHGWSKQAPAGMVRLSMAEIDAELEQIFGAST